MLVLVCLVDTRGALELEDLALGVAEVLEGAADGALLAAVLGAADGSDLAGGLQGGRVIAVRSSARRRKRRRRGRTPQTKTLTFSAAEASMPAFDLMSSGVT